MSGVEVGDYVLATKYSDGDPGDQFCVGLFRGNGFRKAEKITAAEGAWFVRAVKRIESGGVSLWDLLAELRRGTGQ